MVDSTSRPRVGNVVDIPALCRGPEKTVSVPDFAAAALFTRRM